VLFTEVSYQISTETFRRGLSQRPVSLSVASYFSVGSVCGNERERASVAVEQDSKTSSDDQLESCSCPVEPHRIHFHCRACSFTSAFRKTIVQHEIVHRSNSDRVEESRVLEVKSIDLKTLAGALEARASDVKSIDLKTLAGALEARAAKDNGGQAKALVKDSNNSTDGQLESCTCVGLHRVHFHCRVCSYMSPFRKAVVQHETVRHKENEVGEKSKVSVDDNQPGAGRMLSQVEERPAGNEKIRQQVVDPCLVKGDVRNIY
jgi:hypothetical protein